MSLWMSGIAFVVAMLLAFVDRWMDNADVDLTLLVRLLLVAGALMIGLNAYLEAA